MQKDNQFLVTCFAYLTAMLLLLTIQILASLGCFNALSDEALEIIFSLVPQILVMFLIPLLILWGYRRAKHQPQPLVNVFKTVQLGKISFKNVLLALMLGVCLYLLNIFVSSFFAGILQTFGYQYPENENVFHGVGGLLVSLALTAVLPAFCEEFLHRGVLLQSFTKQFGVHRAVVMVSLLFGLMHMNVGQFFYTTVLGWFFCIAVLAGQSLWIGVIVHFVNNALAVYFSYAEELNLPFLGLLTGILSNPILLILMLLIVVVVIGEIMRHLAHENFVRHIDTYTVRYLSSQNRFHADDFEQVKFALTKVIRGMPTWRATFAYIETFERPKRPQPLAQTLLVALFLLGSAVTMLTFVWGTW